jgi:hypothetical protein
MLEKYSKEDIENAKDLTSPFPIGFVPALIADVQERLSNKGNEMLVVTYQSLDDPTATVNDYITDNEYTARKIKHIQTCFGIPYGAPAPAWKYKKGVVRTEVDIYNGYKKAKVAGYCKYNPDLKYENHIPQENVQKEQTPPQSTVDALLDKVPF